MSQQHIETNRQAFTRQAAAYAVSHIITNTDRLSRLVEATDPRPSDHALEVACGPGLVSLALAPHVAKVLGIDVTEGPIAIARSKAREAGVANAEFRVADAYAIPCVGGSFDILVSRYAFHHMEDPRGVLREMVRCARPGARIVVEDMYTSGDPARAAFHNRVEILRDPSHHRALGLAELIGIFGESGIEVETVTTGEIDQNVEFWLSEMSADSEAATEVRDLLQRDAQENLSILGPRSESGEWVFTHRTAIVSGRKL